MCSSVYHDGLRMKNTIYFLIFLSCGARVKLDDSAESADPKCWPSTSFSNPHSDCVGSDTHGFLGYADYNCSYKAGCTNPNYRLNTCACGGQQAGSRCEISVGNDPIDSRSFPQNEHGNLYYGTNHCPNETFSLQPTQNGNQVYSIDFAWLGNRGPTPPSQLKMEATKLYCNGSKTNEQLEIPSNFDWNHLEPRSTQTMRYLCHGYSSCTYPYTWNLDAEKCDEDWWLIFRFRILPLSTFEECPIPDSHMLQDRTRGSDCFWVGGNITAKFYQIQGNAQELQTFTVDNATTIYLRESCQRNGGDVIINVKNEAQMEDDIKFLYKEFKDKGTLPDGTEGTDFGVLAFVQAKYYTSNRRVDASLFDNVHVLIQGIKEGSFPSRTANFFALCIGPPSPPSDAVDVSTTGTTTPRTTTTAPPNTRNCPQLEDLPFNIDDIPETEPGTEFTGVCPEGMEGLITLQCLPDGTWDNGGFPDMSGCRRVDLDEYEDQLIEGDAPVDGILNDIAEVLKQNTIVAGDLLQILDISELAFDTAKAQIEDTETLDPSRYLKSHAGMSDLVLSKEDSWRGLLSETRRKAFTSIQKTMDRVVFLGAENAELEHESEFLVMKVGKFDTSRDATFSFSNSELVLPKEVFAADFRQPVGFIGYKNLHDLLKRVEREDLNTRVLGANIEKPGGFGSDPAHWPRIIFRHLERIKVPSGKPNNTWCRFWNDQTSQWSSEGCEVEKVTPEFTTCRCNHLTNFAVLMNPSLIDSGLLSAITTWSSSFCIVFLCIAFFSFVVETKKKLQLKYIILIFICGHLILGQLLLLTMLERTENETTCAVMAAFMHFFFLSSLLWMVAEGAQVFISVFLLIRKNRLEGLPEWFSIRNSILAVHVVSLLVIALTAAIGWGEAYGAVNYCWLNRDNGAIWAFLAPLALIVTVNVVMFGLIMYSLRKYENEQQKNKKKGTKDKKDHKKDSNPEEESAREKERELEREKERREAWRRRALWVKRILSLVVVFGVTWGIGFLLLFDNDNPKTVDIVGVLFILLNTSQGIVILFFYVLLDRQIDWARTVRNSVHALSSRIRGIKGDSDKDRSRRPTMTTSTGGHTSTTVPQDYYRTTGNITVMHKSKSGSTSMAETNNIGGSETNKTVSPGNDF